jgi:NADH-quinone oxidoreductase subunit I
VEELMEAPDVHSRGASDQAPLASASLGGPPKPEAKAARARPTYANTDVRVIVRAILRTMRVTFVNLFRKPVTVHYPDKTRAYPDRYRGLLALVYEKDTGEEACIGCRLCEYVCPPAVIQVEMLKTPKRNYAKTFTLELYACEFCELCVQVCPTDAIVMMKSFDLSTSDRRELLLDKDRLHALGLQHEQSWATGTRLRDMQGPPKQARAVATAEAAAALAASVDKAAATGPHAEKVDGVA